MKKLLLSLLVSLFAAAAHADGTSNGLVAWPWFLDNGVVLFGTSTGITGRPACSTSNRYAIDGTTAAGKAQLAGILSAYALGKTVAFVGNGTCSLEGTSETIRYFTITS